MHWSDAEAIIVQYADGTQKAVLKSHRPEDQENDVWGWSDDETGFTYDELEDMTVIPLVPLF